MRKINDGPLLTLFKTVDVNYRGFLLDSFVHASISAAFFEKIATDFAAIREAGMKVILRFAYTNTTHTGDCPDPYKIGPPHGDAAPQIVLEHISQLKPLLQKNADIIAVMQMGFIGIREKIILRIILEMPLKTVWQK